MSFDKGFNQLGVARNKPRSHTVDAKCDLTRSSGVGRYTVYSMVVGQLYQIKSVAYLYGFVYFFRKFAGFRVVSAQ